MIGGVKTRPRISKIAPAASLCVTQTGVVEFETTMPLPSCEQSPPALIINNNTCFCRSKVESGSVYTS